MRALLVMSKIILRKLNARLDPMNHDEWLSHIERLKEICPLRYNKEVLTGPYIMEEIYKVTGGDAIICTDVGQHQMWAAQYYKYKRPRQLLTSGGLGTMGYGLGAAIGAKMGCKDKTVINIAGDGCFRMNMNEIATATRYNIPVIELYLTTMFWVWCASGRPCSMENAIPRRSFTIRWISSRRQRAWARESIPYHEERGCGAGAARGDQPKYPGYDRVPDRQR